MASKITPGEVDLSKAARASIIAHLNKLMSNGTVLVVPSAPGAAPFCNTNPKDLDNFRNRALCLTCIAGLGMLPQINLPVAATLDGSPVGIGLIAARGNDEALIDFAVEVERRLAAA